MSALSNGIFLGVDCGATKTHYCLYDGEGTRLAFIQRGTASHEQFDDGFEGARRAMAAGLAELMAAAADGPAGRVLAPADITCSVFGLAGADLPAQHRRLEAIVADLGFRRSLVVNDAFLGVKAGTAGGVGICSINGTGTTCAAIDPTGAMLQIGGIGPVSGDDGGGSYLAQRVYRSIYESFYRCGRPTLMTGLLFAQLGIVSPEELIERHVDDAIDHGLAVRTAFDAAARYDPEALALLEHVGTSLGRSVVGATRRLDFPAAEPIEVVLAGSVHVKGSNPTLRLAFEHTVRAELDGRVNFHVLKEPPVAGAVFWAMERGGIEPGADLRRRVLGSLMMN